MLVLDVITIRTHRVTAQHGQRTHQLGVSGVTLEGSKKESYVHES